MKTDGDGWLGGPLLRCLTTSNPNDQCVSVDLKRERNAVGVSFVALAILFAYAREHLTACLKPIV